MDNEERKEISQMQETTIPESNAKEHPSKLSKTMQEMNGFNEKVNNTSKDVEEDLPGVGKDIHQVQTFVEKKKENLQNVEQDSGEKKRKPFPKQNYKAKYTVPQPFSLSSEKRMSKTMSALVSSSPSLSRSLSFK